MASGAPVAARSVIVPRMRNAYLVAIVVVACSKSSPPPIAEKPVTAPATAPPAEPVKPAPVVDATPDVPAGPDAARDAELAKVAATVIDAFTNSEPVLTRDGKRVVFASNRDGLPQLYIGDAARPGAPATRPVLASEGVTAAALTVDGKAMVFSSDKGADENWSYFRVNLDGSSLVELTPGARWRRDPAILVDGKPDTLFYSARPMASVATGVYATSATAPGE